ncbi:MAG: SDR family oxidoreductase [Verrucomicrobiales bacterium]|nr:SDR family oxidoreductase [Verrucomicrobiales bacterium]
MKLDLTGKRAFVTGSSGGIGQAIAIALANAGADVVIQYYSDKEGAGKTLAEIGPETRTMVVGGDVSDPSIVEQWFDQIDSEWGGLDIFVNNAGIDGERQTVTDSVIEDWEGVISINLLGGYYGIRQALKRMVPKKSGVILSVTSVHEKIPWAGQSAYCASKAGISMLTQSLALEVSDQNVRVLCLAPGAIKTDINKDVWTDEEQLDDLHSKIPMNRMGEVDEIGNLAVALVSDQAGSYVTGTTIFADGGMVTYPSFASGG